MLSYHEEWRRDKGIEVGARSTKEMQRQSKGQKKVKKNKAKKKETVGGFTNDLEQLLAKSHSGQSVNKIFTTFFFFLSR